MFDKELMDPGFGDGEYESTSETSLVIWGARLRLFVYTCIMLVCEHESGMFGARPAGRVQWPQRSGGE